MTRELKFRAWDKEREGMLLRPLLAVGGQTFATIEEHVNTDGIIDAHDDRFEIMQYTGLKDKNGKEIYEGDILINTKHRNQLVEVYWRGCTKKSECINGEDWISWGGWYFRKVHNTSELTYAIYNTEIEVVGNIYQHSNLLEK